MRKNPFRGSKVLHLALVGATGLYAASGLAAGKKPAAKAPHPVSHADTVEVFFDGLKDGAEVEKTFKVKFGVRGMKVMPAGTTDLNTGHHHLIIDAPAVGANEVVPADTSHVHYGKGQTETELTFEPGTHHTLILQFADGGHKVYPSPKATAKIDVVVKAAAEVKH